MPSNAAQRDRRKRLLANMLETMNDIPQERVLAIFSLKEKVSIRKAKEYVEEIRLARTVEQETVLQ